MRLGDVKMSAEEKTNRVNGRAFATRYLARKAYEDGALDLAMKEFIFDHPERADEVPEFVTWMLTH
jgi:hypothetical protein